MLSTLLIGITLIVVYSITLSLYTEQRIEITDKQLSLDLNTIRRELRFDDEGKLDIYTQPESTAFLYGNRQNIHYSVRNPAGHTQRISANMILIGPPLPVLDDVSQTIGNFTQAGVRYRLLTNNYPQTAHAGNENLVIQILQPLKRFDEDHSQLVTLLLAITPLPLLLVTIGSWILAGVSLRPVNKLINTVNDIGIHDLTKRLGSTSNDEIGRLAVTFNEMLDRLEQSFAALTRFTSDASHEMRTPLTALRTQAEVALSKSRNNDDYREVLGSLLEDMARLEHLIDTLLHLARCDAGLVQPNMQSVNFSELSRKWLDNLSTLAAEKHLGMELHIQENITATADPGFIERILVNLIDNAIRYTPENGDISFNLLQIDNVVEIRICNTGPGIPTDERERIFERFVRLQRTRHDTSGAGLGLAIARRAAELHHGNIVISDNSPSGVCFIVSLPCYS